MQNRTPVLESPFLRFSKPSYAKPKPPPPNVALTAATESSPAINFANQEDLRKNQSIVRGVSYGVMSMVLRAPWRFTIQP
eukprot:1101494-Rhodomonas_salina.1